MKIGFIGHGDNLTMSEQLKSEQGVITNGLAAWHEEVRVGTLVKQAIMGTLDYNDITEMLDEGTLYIFSNGQSKTDIVGLQWIYAKVAFKLFEAHPEIGFEWIQAHHSDAHLHYLSHLDVVLTMGEVDEALIDTLLDMNPELQIMPVPEALPV